MSEHAAVAAQQFVLVSNELCAPSELHRTARSCILFPSADEQYKIYFAYKSIYVSIWPSLLQDSFQATIKAELVSSDVYMIA